ncbi:hypothetical protein BGW38_004564, partial [Lunasporangiospora selenospora]
MDSIKMNSELKRFFGDIQDVEKADHFKFFDRSTGRQQGSSESAWLAGLKALANSGYPKFVNSAEVLQKKYDKSKKDGLLKSYWKKRKAEEELVEEADDAAYESAKLVVRSSRLKVNHAFNTVDERTKVTIPGLEEDPIGDVVGENDPVGGGVNVTTNNAVDGAVQENATGDEVQVTPECDEGTIRNIAEDQIAFIRMGFNTLSLIEIGTVFVLTVTISTTPLRRISFGRSLTSEDLSALGYSSNDGHRDNPLQAAAPPFLKLLIEADLPSSDPGDSSFSSSRGLYESTSRVYSWNYLEGNGRLDSSVNSAWMYNDVDISHDLMDFRHRVIQENGALNHPHQKLAVNFVFLLEGEHQIKGLHLEIDDEPWAALCEATKDHVDPLTKGTLDEALRWVELLSQGSPDTFKSLLRSTPPNDPHLLSILNLMSVSGHLWDSEPSNEDSFLKSWLGPFLSTYLGNIAFTTSA